MNHCYRLVFNVANQVWQAVAETAKSHTKSCRKSKSCRITKLSRKTKSGKAAAVVMLSVLSLNVAWADPAPNALPTGGQVVAGQSAIAQNGNVLNIQQTTQKSIINWNTYNIGANATVNYVQPNASAISLNRVLSADPSSIFGHLNANGQVWLINPNGVLFGQGAQVNVGGLLASTLNITDDDFLSGNYKFTGSLFGSTGSVVNMGSIVANNGGYVAMLAPEVRNEGIITALQGTSVLAAGDAITLDFNGNHLINVQVDSANINTLVENKNLIKVGNGQVIMSSKAADGLITSVINNSGRIEADSMVSNGGVVRLIGAKTVINSGEISAQSSAGKGGTVHMLGDHVGVLGTGSINASGKTGGGTLLIGGDTHGLVSGDFQGNNANIQNATKTFISQNAKLTADATDTGNGGKVIVWADDITRYYGSISAKGGVNGGNGGFAEVSGKRLLNFLGNVDVSAAQGVGGNLLLDPLNITLTNADVNTAGFTVPGDLTEAFADDLGLNSTFNVNAGGSFAGIAAGSTITLQATNDITVANAFDVATATGSANNSLVLQANNNINVNAAVTTTGTGAITLAANADATGGGDVNVAANVSAQSGGITLSGVNITRTAGNITSIGASGLNGGNINMTATGAISLGGATVSNNGGGLAVAGGNAGNINIVAGTGFSLLGAIISGGPASLGANTVGGNGGNVSISSATGNVSTGAITTNGGAAGGGNAAGSNAGNISISASAGNVTTGNLTASTGNASGTGVGGIASTVALSGGSVTAGAISTAAGTGVGALGGNVNVTTTGATTSTIASINANSNGAITINNTDTLTVTGAIVGTGTTLTKSGAGTLALTGTSTYTGLTTVNTGTLSIGNGGTTGLIANAGGIANSATVIFNRSNVHSYGGAISGTGVVVKDGAGVFTFSGANTYTGATNILAGTLQDSASIPNSSAVNISLGATLNLNNVAEIVGSINGAGNITMGSAALTSGGNNLSTNFSGVISGTGGNFNKAGTGILELSGANTYTGLTQVQAGTLSAASINALGAIGAGTTVTKGATLNVNNVTLAAEPITLSVGAGVAIGALTGTGAAVVAGNVTTAAASRIGTTSGTSILTISGIVTSPTFAVNIAGTGDVIATNTANNFGSVGITGAKNVSLVDANNLALTTSTLTGNLTAQALAGNITLTNAVSTTGGDITLAGVNFINNAGASALTASGLGKRWLVYANTHTGNTFNLLNSGNQAIWNTAPLAAVSQTGNRYVFANNPGTLTVTSTNQAKTYGQNGAPIVANAYNVTGTFINATTFGNVFTQDTAANTVTGSATSTGSVVTANVGNYAINVTPVTASTGYTLIKNSTGNLTVNPASLSISANNQVKTYGQTFNFAGTEFTSLGLQNSETIGSATLTSTGAAATANVAGSPYAITASTATGGTFNATNYTINYVNGALNIGKAAASVTANSSNVTYNGLGQAVTGFTASGLVNGETTAVLTGVSTSGGSGTNAGTYSHTINGVDSNYNLTLVNGALNIGKAAATVTANDATKIQGSPNPIFTSTIIGLVNGETSAVLTAALGYNTSAITSSPAGNYAITPFGLSAANYDITFIDGVLAVNAPANIAALGLGLNLALTRPEQARQTCVTQSAGSAMISGLDAFGVDDVEYKEAVSQPLVGGVVANALISPACLKI